MPTYRQVQQIIRALAHPTRALTSARFFKTGPGQYAEGDIFIGLTVPECRQIARQFSTLSLPQLHHLLNSPIHEDRLIALLILVTQFQSGSFKTKKQIVNFYLQHSKKINNWDLVDLSADKILGVYLLHRSPRTLYILANSHNLWERRIAIVSTLAFIKQKNYHVTFDLTLKLSNDKHDLIHKATGWMLREVGKHCSPSILKHFLQQYSSRLPRTTLRYAIEHFSESERKKFLKQKS